MMNTNIRIQQIQVSGIRRFDEAISQIPDIIRLTVGEPDLPTHPKSRKKSGNSSYS